MNKMYPVCCALAHVAVAVACCGVVQATPQPRKASPQNGFDVYLRASKLIVSARPAVDALDDGHAATDLKERARRYSLARREAWLKQNAAGFTVFQQALKLPTKHPMFNPRETIPLFPEYASFRQLARDKAIERNTREMRGDWGGAMQSRIDIVQMGQDTARGGALLGYLTGTACQAIGRDQPWEAIEMLDVTQCRAALARLEDIYRRRIVELDVLREEKRYGLAQLHALARESSWRETFPLMAQSTSTRDKVRTISLAAVQRNYISRMDAIIAKTRLPYASSKAPTFPAVDPISAMMSGIYENTSYLFARHDAANALWISALALRTFRLEQGSYPDHLSELVPGYLKTIPADPFGNGETLRYKRISETYLLWSIGPDKVDDSGRPILASKRERGILSDKSRVPYVTPEAIGDFVAGKNR